MVREGLETKIITSKEAAEIKKYDKLLSDVVDVDDFAPKIYKTLK